MESPSHSLQPCHFVIIETEKNFCCHYFLWPSNMMHLPCPHVVEPRVYENTHT